MTASSPEVLRLEGVRKAFGGKVALDGADFAVRAGEIHALLGENGAGKSTLMNVVFGLTARDAGRMYYGGRELGRMTPQRASELGIGMVHQHFRLVDELSVAQNVALGSRSWPDALDHRWSGDFLGMMQRVGLDVSPDTPVGRLALGQRQRVEILKALFRRARLLILDEPTAVLAPGEIADLFGTVSSLAEAGVAVVLITHKLPEALSISSRVTVLRQGRVVLSSDSAATGERELASAMVGDQAALVERAPDATEPGNPVLTLESVCYRPPDGQAVQEISFTLGAGEILGIAGVEGNGQDALAAVLSGTARPDSGRLRLADSDITHASVADRLLLGLAHIPGDRQSQALVLGFSLRDNTLLGRWPLPALRLGPIVRMQRLREITRDIISSYGIRGAAENTPASDLSGGNQQRLVIGRQLVPGLRALIAANPTRGLDIDATRYVHERIRDHCAAGGVAVLLSSDLDELRALSTRIGVLYRGRLAAEFPPDASQEVIGLAMTSGRHAVA